MLLELSLLVLTCAAGFAAGWYWQQPRVRHLEAQCSELSFLVGDAAAAAFIQDEKYQELLSQVFEQKGKLNATQKVPL